MTRIRKHILNHSLIVRLTEINKYQHKYKDGVKCFYISHKRRCNEIEGKISISL